MTYDNVARKVQSRQMTARGIHLVHSRNWPAEQKPIESPARKPRIQTVRERKPVGKVGLVATVSAPLIWAGDAMLRMIKIL